MLNPKRLALSEHAVQRYIERVAPVLTFDQAHDQLLLLVRTEGVTQREAPPWVNDLPPDQTHYEGGRREIDGWVDLGRTGIWLPVRNSTCLSVLVQGGMSPEKRAARNARKAKRRAARRTARDFKQWRGESAPRWS